MPSHDFICGGCAVSFCLGRFSDISLKASIEYAKYFCTWLSWQWLYVQLNEHCFLNFYPKKCLSRSKVICLEPKRELIPFLAARSDLDTFLVVDNLGSSQQDMRQLCPPQNGPIVSPIQWIFWQVIHTESLLCPAIWHTQSQLPLGYSILLGSCSYKKF